MFFSEEFKPEYFALPIEAQDTLQTLIKLLKQMGPQLGRPHVDTLKGSRHANMKELRFKAANGVWRVAFVFDPDRHGIILVAGDKSGLVERRFYRDLIKKADQRFDDHLKRMTEKGD